MCGFVDSTCFTWCLTLLMSVALLSPAASLEGTTCRDRTGDFPPQEYRLRTCTMCYVYLFKNQKDLWPTRDYSGLFHRNATIGGAPYVVYPEIRNQSTVTSVCGTLTSSECDRWQSCCQAADHCCDTQILSAPPSPHPTSSPYCSNTWDGYYCWPEAVPGSTSTASCPTYISQHSYTTREATKVCLDNGTWYKKDGHEWTDYTSCLGKDSYITGVYIAVACSFISLLFLVPAIVIFLAFRELRKQLRIRLHVQFFLSLAVSGIAGILWYLLVHYDMLATASSDDTVMYRNPVWCRILSFLKIYFTSTNYFWMFCEGYFLHRLITNAFEPPKTLILLYLIGWVAPLIPAVCLAIIKAVRNEDKCWTESHVHLQWIIQGPNFLCLVMNLIFLSNILRILLFQMHAHPHEPSSFRRGLKAAFMLIPLFGLQMFVTIYRPPPGAMAEREYEYVTFFVVHSQGVFVSLIYCFFNGEVVTHIKRFIPCLFRRRASRHAYVTGNTTQVTVYEDRRSVDGSNNSLQILCCPLDSITKWRSSPKGVSV